MLLITTKIVCPFMYVILLQTLFNLTACRRDNINKVSTGIIVITQGNANKTGCHTAEEESNVSFLFIMNVIKVLVHLKIVCKCS